MREKKRFNAGLPPDAKEEILEVLCTEMEISADEIVAILKKHHVAADEEVLQDRYRRQLGQRLMASIRDDAGRREVLATKRGEYVIVECCNDRQRLQAVRRRIQNQMKGLDLSARKVSGRLTILERLAHKWRRAG